MDFFDEPGERHGFSLDQVVIGFLDYLGHDQVDVQFIELGELGMGHVAGSQGEQVFVPDPVELKKVLSVDLGALTRMLDRLVCKGWVERLPNPNDKRGVLVKLTTSGAAICEQCHQLVGQDLHQELTKNLTADEVATLEHLLKKVLP